MSDLPVPAQVVQLSSRVQVVEQELLTIYETRGRLVAEDIVDAARPEDSPLHRYFEWDDTEAAERYRRLQAGQLVRSVKLLVEDGRDYEIRNWVAVDRDGTGYKPLDIVSADSEQRARVLRRMQREVNALRTRYGHYQEFWATWASLNPDEAAS